MGEGSTEPNNADSRDRRRLTVPEAATVLGVTVDAVRGRIRRKRLEAEHDEHGTVYVWLEQDWTGPGQKKADRPGPSEASRGPSETVAGPPPDESRLVDALEDRISSLERQLTAEREANRENRRLLAAALERIPAIEAPRDEPGAAETGTGASESASPRSDTVGAQAGVQEPEETARRPWWVRWFGG